MVRKEFQLHEVIFKENAYQLWMYSICEGSVDIYSGYGTSDEKKLITLTEGQFFGEIGMIAVMPRTAAAVASAEHVVLEQISNDDFDDYLKNHPENLQPIMSSVSGRIRELTEDLSMIARMTDEALREREGGNVTAGWLSGTVKSLLGKLKEKKAANSEYALMCKRQKALSGEIPPVIHYSAGDVLFRAGDEADCLYDIYDGSVGIYSDYQTNNEKLLNRLLAGDVFGEMGLLDNMPRSATAVCLTNCEIRVVKRENFMDFFRNNPGKILQILHQMCVRLRDLTETYLQVCKTLEELPPVEEQGFQVDLALAKLEYIRQNQLGTSIYDVSGSANWLYEYL